MKIEKSIYEGYLWYSDKPEPKVYIKKELELEISEKTNPFIIEGQLFDGTNSISIKYVDGKYIVNRYEVKEADFNDVNIELKEFLPNRMKDIEKLRFLQYWKPQEEKDELCEKMEVLQPAELVFIGFKVKEK